MSGDAQLQKLLFGLQNATNEKLFIDRGAKLFEKDESKTWIDVYQPRITQLIPVEAPAPVTSTESGLSDKAAAAHSVGQDVEYGRTHALCRV